MVDSLLRRKEIKWGDGMMDGEFDDNESRPDAVVCDKRLLLRAPKGQGYDQEKFIDRAFLYVQRLCLQVQ